MMSADKSAVELLTDLLLRIEAMSDLYASSYTLRSLLKQVKSLLDMDESTPLPRKNELSAYLEQSINKDISNKQLKALYSIINTSLSLIQTQTNDRVELNALRELSKLGVNLQIEERQAEFEARVNRQITSIYSKFESCYTKAKQDGTYPEKMYYFDWLWHELCVIRDVFKYMCEKQKPTTDRSVTKDKKEELKVIDEYPPKEINIEIGGKKFTYKLDESVVDNGNQLTN